MGKALEAMVFEAKMRGRKGNEGSGWLGAALKSRWGGAGQCRLAALGIEALFEFAPVGPGIQARSQESWQNVVQGRERCI